MLELSTVKVKEQLGELLNRVAYGGERVVLLRRGKPVAALVSVDDLHTLQALEAQAVRAREAEAVVATEALG
jgi:prevent-host-death family protein